MLTGKAAFWITDTRNVDPIPGDRVDAVDATACRAYQPVYPVGPSRHLTNKQCLADSVKNITDPKSVHVQQNPVAESSTRLIVYRSG